MFPIKSTFPIEIFIPTIRDDYQGFCKLWSSLFQDKFNNNTVMFKISLNFSKCNYIGINATVILGVFLKSDIGKTHEIRLNLKSIKQQNFQKLRNMDFFTEMVPKGLTTKFVTESDGLIPFKRFLSRDSENSVLEYLEKDWLSKNRLNFSHDVKSSVLSSLWEIFANAFEHGESKLGVFCSGTYDKNSRVLNLLVGDKGIGIVSSVLNYNKGISTSEEAISWALTRGHSTYTSNLKTLGKAQPRGLGFDILKQLVDVNSGLLEIYTDNIIYQRHNNEDIFHPQQSDILGSWVKISLKCKENVIYRFKNEVPDYF
ncbi:hypothetical protein [Pseudocolwellia agarivorans]|uniref:hypothetical protein n=1 Tax=Pseudocolwellia agarivorans TaxID=1911682 RepID=UPI003F88551E